MVTSPLSGFPARRASQRGGCLTKLFVLGALLAGFLAACWIFLLPVALSRALESRTGFKMAVTSFSANPLTARVAVDGLLLSNPSDVFAVPEFMSVRSIRADLELFSLFSDRIVIEDAVLDVERVTLVTNKEHTSNGVLFGRRLVGEASSDKTEPTPAKPSVESPAETAPTVRKEFLIRHMKLRLNKVVLVDASGSSANSKEYAIAFDQEYKDVTSVTEIAMPIVATLAANRRGVSEFFGDFGRKAGDAAKKTGESIKDIFNSIKDKLGQ